MPRVLVMTDRDSLDKIQTVATQQDALVLGFWCSEETARWLSESCKMDVLRLNEAVGEYSQYIEKAYSLIHFLAESSPAYLGTRPMIAWEEFLGDAVLHSLLIGDLHRTLIRRYRDGAEVVFLEPSETQKAFSLFNACSGTPFRIKILESGLWGDRRNGFRRRIREFINLIQEMQQDQDWAPIFWTPLEVLDIRYRVRSALWPKMFGGRVNRWLYGSFANSIRILHRHLSGLDGSNAWVINRFGASRGLKPEDRWYHLWQFGEPAQAREHRGYLQAAVEYFSSLAPEMHHFPLQDFISFIPAVRYFLTRLLPSALAEIDLMHAFLEKTSPRELWVANQWGSEGELIQVANKMGIPVTQVQHGAFHRYFGFSPVFSQRFLVWGSFWRDMLKDSERQKVEIFNPGLEVAPVDRKGDPSRKKQITIFTSPVHAATLWNLEVTGREVSLFVKHLLDSGYKVLLRMHPGDQLAFWRRSLARVIGHLPTEIRFSKGGPLGAVLRETDLGVMFFSTVFLNCLASGIPVIGLGWYPHIWREPLEQTRMVHFANSIEEAMKMVNHFIEEPAHPLEMERFLASTPNPNKLHFS